MKNRTLLLAVAFLFTITPMIGATSIKSETIVKYTDSKDYFGVSADEIYSYMLNFGFHVNSITPIGETSDVYVTTFEKKDFVVHIQNGTIIGHDDVNY